MDQIRTALAWLKRQHFWVLMGLAPLIAVACWSMATGTLTSKFTSNKSAIESEFTATSSIQSQAFKPNDTVNTLQKNETKKLADGVLALWTSLYDRQKEQVLRWPAQLSPRFKDYVANKKFGDNIQDALRNEYMTYIDRRFPELVEIVKAVPIPDEGDTAAAAGGGRAMMGEMMGGGSRGGPMMGGGRGGEMGGGMAAMGGAEEIELPAGKIVDWLADDQTRLKAELQPQQVPSPLAIWVTQENLWVYETILRAIANTNEAAGADRNGNAAVRKIYSMLVGNRATPQASQAGSRIYMPELSASRGMEGEMGMGMEGGGEMGMDGGGEMMGERGMEGEGMGGEGDETQMLLAGRYLGADGKPLPVAGGGGGDAGLDPAAEPAASGGGGGFDFGVEYKRLPVSLMLQVDQRWLSRLIVELANAPLQIEVQEVRVDPQGDTGGGEMMGGRGGGGMGPMGAGGAAGEVQFFDRQPHVKNVVLQGIVYVFNPPDKTLLSVEEEGAADGALEPGI